MHNISSFLRSPFSDITGGMVSHQTLGRCAKIEMDLMECLEAYGLDRGLPKCKCFIDDYRECHTLEKQYKRFVVLREEREKQIKEGKLKGDKMFVTPRIDAF